MIKPIFFLQVLQLWVLLVISSTQNGTLTATSFVNRHPYDIPEISQSPLCHQYRDALLHIKHWRGHEHHAAQCSSFHSTQLSHTDTTFSLGHDDFNVCCISLHRCAWFSWKCNPPKATVGEFSLPSERQRSLQASSPHHCAHLIQQLHSIT